MRTTSVRGDDTGGGSLVFTWRRPHAVSFRLVFLLFCSLFLHVAAFYLVEVVYPPSRKEIIREGVVWLFPAGDGSTRATLARHEKELHHFSGFEAVNGPADEAVVSLRLAYENYRPRLRPLPKLGPETRMEFPEAVPAVLPPLAPDLPAAVAEPVARESSALGRWMCGAGSEPVVVVMDGVLPASLRRRLRGGEARVHLGYGDRGRVRLAAVVDGPGGLWDQELRRALLGMRVPADLPRPEAGGLTWAVVELTF